MTHASVQGLVYGKKIMRYGHILRSSLVKHLKKKKLTREIICPRVIFYYFVIIFGRWLEDIKGYSIDAIRSADRRISYKNSLKGNVCVKKV